MGSRPDGPSGAGRGSCRRCRSRPISSPPPNGRSASGPSLTAAGFLAARATRPCARPDGTDVTRDDSASVERSAVGCSQTRRRHMTQTLITRAGFARLLEQLEHLTTTRRHEVAERIHYAVLSERNMAENVDYQDAREAQALLERRIGDLPRRDPAA